MKKFLASAMLAATIVGGGMTVAATAASAAPAPTKTTEAAKPQRHVRRHALRAAIKTSADTLGMKPKDLVAELNSGKSVADVAKAKNVDIAKVKAALTAKGNAAIDKALAAQKIDAAKAAKAKARLPKAIDRFVNAHKGAHKPAGN